MILVVTGLAAWVLMPNVGMWPPELGMDLEGGTTITYTIDKESINEMRDQGETIQDALQQTITIISTRINSLGVKDLAVRQEGTNRILIQAPSMTKEELNDIKTQMVQLGNLQFPIGLAKLRGGQRPTTTETLQVNGKTPGTLIDYTFNEDEANKQRQKAIEDGKKDLQNPNSYRNGRPYTLRDKDGRMIREIRWLPWAPGQVEEQARRQFQRDDIKEAQAKIALNDAKAGKDYDANHIIGNWVYFDPKVYGKDLKGFSGRDIHKVRKSTSELGGRAVSYEVIHDRQGDFERYTKRYVGRPKCLVLNNELWSAPNINEALRSSVQISGGSDGFSEEEQDWLINCLQSGSLKLRPRLESEEDIAATLGDEARSRGITASIVGAVLVVVFMLMYYRLGGFIATIGLILNLFLMVAMLTLFRATITLPGIAGVILTIGMSVDANILIFERIREELAKGKTLLASVQAGFDRAFVTIIDANLTTIIAAIILYKYGVGPIKGFAVTLMAGIACSLFCALFVSKTIFATGLRGGWIKSFSMMRWLKPDLAIDFLGKRKLALGLSLAAVGLSVVAFVSAGDSKYGLDFTGGTIFRVNLAESATSGDVKSLLSAVKNQDGTPRYELTEVTGLRDTADSSGTRYTGFEIKVPITYTFDAASMTKVLKGHFERAFATLAKAKLESLGEASLNEDTGEWRIEGKFDRVVSDSDLGNALNSYEHERAYPLQTVDLNGIGYSEDKRTGEIKSQQWIFDVDERALLGQEELAGIREAFAGKLVAEEANQIPRVNYVGPNVVADLKQQAIVAIVLSMIALVLYLWFRFKEIKFGLGAVIAVFHDVIIALGAVVVANAMDLNVPINLPIIAGFLTIIGYSLNDTIVLYDRIRENMGNVKGSYQETVNLSINQTLARTVLTSLTTFLVVLVLFVFNLGQQSNIEGIAFTLMIGVIVGTYSSIFIASPALVWLHNREVAKAAAKKA